MSGGSGRAHGRADDRLAFPFPSPSRPPPPHPDQVPPRRGGLLPGPTPGLRGEAAEAEAEAIAREEQEEEGEGGREALCASPPPPDEEWNVVVERVELVIPPSAWQRSYHVFRFRLMHRPTGRVFHMEKVVMGLKRRKGVCGAQSMIHLALTTNHLSTHIHP